MVVKIRFLRLGTKRNQVYNIVVANGRSKPTGKPIEILGTFDPRPDLSTSTKHTNLNFERTKYWLGVGAQPTDSAAKLLARAGLIPPKLPTRIPTFTPTFKD
ncbi:37S ribosomal protein S16, mitochondrial [Zancudomyces culisetae]|uniref:37S ribosomal protein S16, mitochondrial n=1 Tax=Zancudomyces culisetae TaxID=1213189 RepID=A0A1R1PYH2_ZANCU|nr:37S ribosomal protein S16, mitochondrial [Zancudomyces culisetae]|eukprot:OMH85997.1 37S ribosomal protein S16, mitochondrial [Zancudomyces culisetae]